jgi:hypothetical protein
MKEFSLNSADDTQKVLYTYFPGQKLSFTAKFSQIPHRYRLQILDRKENARFNRYGKGSENGIDLQWPIPKLLRNRHFGLWQIAIESDKEKFQMFFEVKNQEKFFTGE